MVRFAALVVSAVLLSCSCAHKVPAKGETVTTAPRIQSPSPVVSIAGNRIVFNGEVNPESAQAFGIAFDTMLRPGAKVVIVELNTPGGYVSAGFEIAKKIEESPIPVVCVVDGVAASMGAYILQSCGGRVMTSRSVIMFHNPLSSIQLEDGDTMLEALGHAMAAHCAHRMNIPLADYEKKIAGTKKWWLTSSGALEVGAIDTQVNNIAEVLEAAAAVTQ